MKNQLKLLRVRRGYTQGTLADVAGLSRVTVNRIERAEHFPDGYTMLRLAEALGCSAVEIFPCLGSI